FAGNELVTPKLFDKAKGLLGFGGGDEEGGVLSGLDRMRSGANFLGGSTNNANTNYSVNSPITINVPPGTDPSEVGNRAKEGVTEHLDRILREAQRSLTPAVAY